MSLFETMGLKAEILGAIQELGFENPTPVQEQTIPFLLESDQDMVALAQTGTGKTAAFGLPIVQQFDSSVKAPQALILSPTRELALQIAKDLETFSKTLTERKLPHYMAAPTSGNRLKSLRAVPR